MNKILSDIKVIATSATSSWESWCAVFAGSDLPGKLRTFQSHLADVTMLVAALWIPVDRYKAGHHGHSQGILYRKYQQDSTGILSWDQMKISSAMTHDPGIRPNLISRPRHACDWSWFWWTTNATHLCDTVSSSFKYRFHQILKKCLYGIVKVFETPNTTHHVLSSYFHQKRGIEWVGDQYSWQKQHPILTSGEIFIRSILCELTLSWWLRGFSRWFDKVSVKFES